jgi:hypothetical protein
MWREYAPKLLANAIKKPKQEKAKKIVDRIARNISVG